MASKLLPVGCLTPQQHGPTRYRLPWPQTNVPSRCRPRQRRRRQGRRRSPSTRARRATRPAPCTHPTNRPSCQTRGEGGEARVVRREGPTITLEGCHSFPPPHSAQAAGGPPTHQQPLFNRHRPARRVLLGDLRGHHLGGAAVVLRLHVRAHRDVIGVEVLCRRDASAGKVGGRKSE